MRGRGEAMPMTPCDACELTVPSRDGVDLKARWWAVPRPRGIVVVAHGLGEHRRRLCAPR